MQVSGTYKLPPELRDLEDHATQGAAALKQAHVKGVPSLLATPHSGAANPVCLTPRPAPRLVCGTGSATAKTPYTAYDVSRSSAQGPSGRPPILKVDPESLLADSAIASAWMAVSCIFL